MKSYYSITLFILFAFGMALTGVVKTAMLRQDLSTADAAVVALTIIVVMLAYRLSLAERRIAHLENRLEELIKPHDCHDRAARDLHKVGDITEECPSQNCIKSENGNNNGEI